MSFSFNGPSFRPMIQESQSMKNNGGGGNTGYFQRGKKKKGEDIDIFGASEDRDEFVLSEDENEVKEPEGFLDKIVKKTRDVVQKVKDTTENNNPFKME